MPKQSLITVFEHQVLKTDKGEKEMRITVDQLKALQSYYKNGVPYFSLIHNGIQFNEYVGVIKVGNTLIEVLPKADKYSNDKETWRSLLVGMLWKVSNLEIRSTSNANLKIKPNTILDLYFELFIKEVEYLFRVGLIKQYRKKEGNNTALKGNIIFAKHLQKNLVHQEQFYTRFTAYDVVHPLNQILLKTLLLLNQINPTPSLKSRIGALLLNFPEMPDLNVSEASFNKIIYNRKSYSYKKAIEIAKMILLKYYPDVEKGKNDVLALMFDMNKLWEQFVYVSLKNHKPTSFSIKAQISKNFWRPMGGRKTTMKPDIVLDNGNDEFYVLDTKWKNLNDYNPSPDDLRQLYVYHHYFKAKKVALVYPGDFEERNGLYFEPDGNLSNKVCSILPIGGNKNINAWQSEIYEKVINWTSTQFDTEDAIVQEFSKEYSNRLKSINKGGEAKVRAVRIF